MKKEYTPIPGLGTGRGSFRVAMRHRLYQGADHLLLVQSTGFTEDYRRLYYRDIGCVVVRLTQRRLWTGVVLGVLIGIMLWIFSYAWSNGAIAIGLGFIAGIALLFAIAFFVNIARGPTCTCYITTMVQTVQVPTPSRLYKVSALTYFLRVKTAGVASAAPAPQA